MRICGRSISSLPSIFCFTKDAPGSKAMVKESCYRAITGSLAAIASYILHKQITFQGCSILKQKAVEGLLSTTLSCQHFAEKCFTACKNSMFGMQSAQVIKTTDRFVFCGRAGIIIEHFNASFPQNHCYRPCYQGCGQGLQNIMPSDFISNALLREITYLPAGIAVAGIIDVIINQLDLSQIGVKREWKTCGVREVLKWGCGITACTMVSSSSISSAVLAYGAYRATYIALTCLIQYCSSRNKNDRAEANNNVRERNSPRERKVRRLKWRIFSQSVFAGRMNMARRARRC